MNAKEVSERRGALGPWPLRGWAWSVWAWSFLVMVTVGLFLGWVVAQTRGTSAFGVDLAIVVWLAEHRSPWLSAVTDTTTVLASTGWVTVAVAAGALAFAVTTRRWRDTLLLPLSVGTEALVFLAVSTIVERSRPPVEQLDPLPPTPAFPSGHVGASVALYGALAVTVFWNRTDWLPRATAIGAAISLVAITMFGRVYRGMHYPSDVIAGAILGTGTLAIGVVLARGATRRTGVRHVSARRWVRRFLRMGLAIGLTSGAIVLYGLLEPKFLNAERIRARVPDLPAAWEGATVAFISDFQLGIVFDNASTTKAAVEEIVEERPQLVVLGGDFVYSADPDPSEQVARTVALFEPLVAAGIPTYAVLGNHDVRQGMGTLLEGALEQVGIPVLTNEAVAIGSEDGNRDQLYLVALGPHIPGMDDASRALRDVPDDAARVVVMHNPASFPALPAGSAPIALAGHTHGGQIRVPFLPEWSYLAWIQEGRVTTDGFIPQYGARGNTLYVSKGIGMSRVPIRINTVPEVTLLELNPG